MSEQGMERHEGNADRQNEPLRVERSPKRVRALVAGHTVFDTNAAMLVWEKPQYPTYYVPARDVQAKLVASSDGGGRALHDQLGEPRMQDVLVGEEVRARAVLSFPDASDPDLQDLVRVKWGSMDEWLEEDEPVYVHPRDPYKRVDILASSRHVCIEVDGVTVADSRQPRILFETGLPPRYYLPMTDVHMDLLQPSDTVTRCPYKGDAGWWSLQLDGNRYEDLAWVYRVPRPESQQVAGLVAFLQERVDLRLDGRLQERPHTPFG